MNDISTQLQALDAMIAEGKILESLEPFFDANCTFTEASDGASRTTRLAQQEHLSGFFSTLSKFNGATLRSSAIEGTTSFSEWTFDMVAGDGSPIVWNEVLIRSWADGKVTAEKYYNANA